MYKRLGSSLLQYLGRNIGGLLLGCAPVIVIAFLLSSALFDSWDSKGAGPGVYPSGAATLEVQENGGPILLTGAHSVEPIAIERREPMRAAVCWSIAPCLLLRSLDFAVVSVDAPIALAGGAVIVRQDAANWNPFFPYLNDPEFLFACMTFVGVAGALFTRRLQR